MRLITFASLLLLVSPLHIARGEYVIPQMGGGQVGQGAAPMKHADIAFDGTNIDVHVDTSVGIPLLRPLQYPDEFDPSQPWSVLGTKAYNFQYGWNPGGFIRLPQDAWIWIEQLDASPGLEVYQRPPASPAYEPIFGTDDSPLRWRWSISMTHNVYAVQDPYAEDFRAVYRVYIGDDTVDPGEPLLDYGSAIVTFQFQATPLGDFDGSGVYDCDDINDLTEEIAFQTHNLAFDMNADGAVDTVDRDIWLVQAGAANETVTGGYPYLLGDANLDGAVDVSDFNAWNTAKFTHSPAWCAGDFDANGVVDVSDFNIWNGAKFTGSGDISPVPEPATCWLSVLAVLATTAVCRRHCQTLMLGTRDRED